RSADAAGPVYAFEPAGLAQALAGRAAGADYHRGRGLHRLAGAAALTVQSRGAPEAALRGALAGPRRLAGVRRPPAGGHMGTFGKRGDARGKRRQNPWTAELGGAHSGAAGPDQPPATGGGQAPGKGQNAKGGTADGAQEVGRVGFDGRVAAWGRVAVGHGAEGVGVLGSRGVRAPAAAVGR